MFNSTPTAAKFVRIAEPPYDIPAVRVTGKDVTLGVPVTIWRGAEFSYLTFAVESCMDGIATAAGADPYQFRRNLLGNAPRLKAVLDLAASKAGWDTKLPAGQGRGMAAFVYSNSNTYVAEVAEVAVQGGACRGSGRDPAKHERPERMASGNHVGGSDHFDQRGVRTFADHTRNTLDLSVVPAIKRISHLPILVDPSHGTGKRNKVTPLSRASVAVGADGLIIEVHHQPDKALSDGIQSLYPDQFDELMAQVRQIAPVVGRTVAAVADAPAALPSVSAKSARGSSVAPLT